MPWLVKLGAVGRGCSQPRGGGGGFALTRRAGVLRFTGLSKGLWEGFFFFFWQKMAKRLDEDDFGGASVAAG